MKLKEWNEVLDYAVDVCRELEENGYNIKAEQYYMYDGRKGVFLIVLDRDGEEFRRYASGTHDTVETYKQYIDMNKRRIIAEC